MSNFRPKNKKKRPSHKVETVHHSFLTKDKNCHYFLFLCDWGERFCGQKMAECFAGLRLIKDDLESNKRRY
jgi:hypothetical protein